MWGEMEKQRPHKAKVQGPVQTTTFVAENNNILNSHCSCPWKWNQAPQLRVTEMSQPPLPCKRGKKRYLHMQIIVAANTFCMSTWVVRFSALAERHCPLVIWHQNNIFKAMCIPALYTASRRPFSFKWDARIWIWILNSKPYFSFLFFIKKINHLN